MTSKQKKLTKNGSDSIQGLRQEQLKERKLMRELLAKERFTRWLLAAVIVLLLLMLLFIGYATDWMQGVSKKDYNDGATVDSSLDSAKTANGSGASNTNGSTGNTSTGSQTSTTSTKSGTDATNNSATTNTNDRATDTKSSTTTTTTTTNNNATVAAQPSPGLLSLYADSSIGGNIETILTQAQLLGLSKECHTSVLIQICDISDGQLMVTTKNLLGTGLVTSVTKNF